MRLVLMVVVFVGAGWIIGDRHGLPDWAGAHVDPVMDKIEGFVTDYTQPLHDGDGDDAVAERPVRTSEPPQVATDENASLRINDAGLDIIKAAEGLRLEAYLSDDRLYIGYGHQMAPGEPRQITEAQADALLREDVRAAEDGVKRVINRPMNENQFSAMVSLTYNLGTGGFSRSAVVTEFNAGNVQGAADAFRNHNRGGGVVLDHLTERREQERALFLTPAR